KFLVSKLGINEFKLLVEAERAILEYDPRWTSYLNDLDASAEEPLKPPSLLQINPLRPEGFDRWYATNVYKQRQAGYATVTIALPLGDATPAQLRAVADISRKYLKETIRSTVEQNLVLRWVSEADLPAVYNELKSAHLADAVADTVVDVASCPGTDTCKLGIAASRGLARELRIRLAEKDFELDESIRGLRIKISGCFNSCGQHHVADLGFYGVSRNKNSYAVPHFQVVLGGEWTNNAGAYGLAIGAVPSKRIPETVDRITGRFVAAPRRRIVPVIHQAHWQDRMQKDAGGIHRHSGARRRSVDLQRLGRPARIHHRRHRRGRMRGRSNLADRFPTG